jgi:hypothetical protein
VSCRTHLSSPQSGRRETCILQIHAPRRYSIWQAHDRRDPGTWRPIPPRYPPAHSALGGTCVDAERGTQARYLGTSRFSETPSRETRLSSKCSIDIVLNLRVVHKLLLCSVASRPRSLIFPPCSRSLILLSPHSYCITLMLFCPRRLLVRRIRSLVLRPAYQPISLRR